jgi:hypothetical protein
MNELEGVNQAFYGDMRNIIIEARTNAVRGVEYAHDDALASRRTHFR